MNPLAPGLRELARLGVRQWLRLRLFLAQRRLAKAETELGLLGWQQAYFDEATQKQVEQITNFEREQARLTNESAAVGLAIRELREQREMGQKQFAGIAAALGSELRQCVATMDQLEEQLAAKRKFEGNFEKAILELDRELREVSEQYRERFRCEHQTPVIHRELIQLRGRSMAIPNEQEDLRQQRFRIASEMEALEAELATRKPVATRIEKKLREARARFASGETAIERESAAREREKRKIEKQIDGLEAAKSNPYRRIGQVLADCRIAPMNQPQALAAVQARRLAIQDLELEIAAARDQSAKEDRAAVRRGWVILAVTAGGLLVAFVLFARG